MTRILFSLLFICAFMKAYAQAPSINLFAPSSGPVGTLVTINGSNLDDGKANIAGKACITISSSASKLVIMIMPGTFTGPISVTTNKGSVSSTPKFILTPTPYPSLQQGNKLVGTGAIGKAAQGNAVAISADGNTAAVGGTGDNNQIGGVWVFTRTGTTWTQQAKILPDNGNISLNNQLIFGNALSFSADGNTLLVGGIEDRQGGDGVGASWIFRRENNVWKQDVKLIGTGNTGTCAQGQDVCLSADGNTAVVYGTGDDFFRGAFWVFTHDTGTWTQQGPKYVPSGLSNFKQVFGGGFHSSIALSADGNTILVSGSIDLPVSSLCTGIIFTRNNGVWTEQSGRLQASGGLQGRAVALSADGNVAMIGGPHDEGQKGGAWIFVKTGTSWVQQGSKLIGPGADAESLQGTTVALSADGNTAIMGEYGFGEHYRGGVWVFTRNGNTWVLQGSQLVGYDTDQYSVSGTAVAISADGKTSINGGGSDNDWQGAAWIFATAPILPPSVVTLPATELSFSGATLNGTVTDNGSLTNITFEYSTNPDLSSSIIAPLKSGANPLNAGTGITSYTSALNNLTPATTYYFRINADNAGGAANGNILSLVTPNRPPAPPIAQTKPATLISSSSATLNGLADDNGSETVVHFEFGTSPTLAGAIATDITTGTSPIVANTGAVNFTNNQIDLTTATAYYFRIVAQNENGITKGNILSFHTQPEVLVIPNTFTPNNDGINDTWNLSSLKLPSNCTVNIFNRYGKRIYTSIGYTTAWDGKYKNANVPVGTYYYVIDLKNGAMPLSGSLTVIR